MTRLPFAILCMIHYFNPHLPCGRWQAISGVNYNMAIFQSTPSLRKVTRWASSRGNFRGISIHTFLAECDNQHPDRSGRIEYFNPHLPCGRWPSTPNTTPRTGIISIHTFLAEGDHATGELSAINNQFQSTPSLRKVTIERTQKLRATIISIHTFLAEGDTNPRPSSNANNISIHTFLAEGDQRYDW